MIEDSVREADCRSLDSLSVHYLLDQATTFRDTHLCTVQNVLSQKLDQWHESDFYRHSPSTAFYIHSYFKFLVLSHQPDLLCFFNPFQDSQRSSILQWDRTHYMQHIHGRSCSGDAAEMQREGQMGSFPEPPASSAHEKSGLWIIKHWCGFFSNALTGTQGLIWLSCCGFIDT